MDDVELLTRLTEWGIGFGLARHAAVFTMADAAGLSLDLAGDPCKNLLLATRRGEVYLLMALARPRRT